MMLKIYENFKSNQEIESICSKYGIENYSINTDGSIDVQGDVKLINYRLTKLPLEFGKVSGNFYCNNMGLTTLEGCPKEVSGIFLCGFNDNITSLEGCPKKVGGYFLCTNNNSITSLEGLEDTVDISDINVWRCDNLYSLDGFPIDFKGKFYCDYTPIEPIYNRYISGTYIEGTNQLAQAIQFFNQLQVVEEVSYGWEISYRKLLEYLKRYKEFGRPTKEKLQQLVGYKYIVR